MIEWELYRSPVLPNPLWKDQAIYGGYSWLEMTDEFWVNRRWEPECRIFQRIRNKELTCHGDCISPFITMLKDAGFFYQCVNVNQGEMVPSVKYDDYLRIVPTTQNVKAFACLRHWNTLVVYGYNTKIQEFLGLYRDNFSSIVGTQELPVTGSKPIELESLYKAHLQQKVIVAKELLKAKEFIVNWSHIVVM